MADSKQIVLIVASKGYQEIEYQVPKHIFEQAGFLVTVASDVTGTVTAKDGSKTVSQLLIKDINPDNFDAFVFVGGPGALEHLDNETSYQLIRQAHEREQVVAAICVATRILAKSGILSGKDATGWNGDHQLRELFEQYNVNLKNQDVVVDDHIVTAIGPSTAREFAENIVSLLTSR